MRKCYEVQIQNNLPKIKPLVSGRLGRETHILVTFWAEIFLLLMIPSPSFTKSCSVFNFWDRMNGKQGKNEKPVCLKYQLMIQGTSLGLVSALHFLHLLIPRGMEVDVTRYQERWDSSLLCCFSAAFLIISSLVKSLWSLDSLSLFSLVSGCVRLCVCVRACVCIPQDFVSKAQWKSVFHNFQFEDIPYTKT